MVTNLVEAVGYALVIAFLVAVWAPLGLLGAGLLLVLWSNTRNQKTKGRTGAALGAALGAFRTALKAQKRGE